MTIPLRRSLGAVRRRWLVILVPLTFAASVLALGGSCADDSAPLLRPIAESADATSAAVSMPPILLPLRPPAAVLSGVPASNTAELENAIARSIDLMMEWLGVRGNELNVEHAEDMEWASSCVGINRPGEVCGQVLTQGYLVRLIDRFGGLHTLHMRQDGSAEWAGEVRVEGVVIAVDVARAVLTVEVSSIPTEFRLVSGSIQMTKGPSSLAVIAPMFLGTSIELAFDANPAGEGPSVVAWLTELP